MREQESKLLTFWRERGGEKRVVESRQAIGVGKSYDRKSKHGDKTRHTKQ